VPGGREGEHGGKKKGSWVHQKAGQEARERGTATKVTRGGKFATCSVKGKTTFEKRMGAKSCRKGGTVEEKNPQEQFVWSQTERERETFSPERRGATRTSAE